MTETTRKHPEDRREDILQAALDLADDGGLYTMTGHQIATRAKCVRTLINHYFYSMSNLQDIVIRRALRLEQWAIVAQASARGDAQVQGMTQDQRTKLSQWLAERLA